MVLSNIYSCHGYICLAFVLSVGCLYTSAADTAADTGPKVVLQANRENLKVSPASLKPQQVHISLGDTATDMTIMWATRVHDISVVEYHTGDRQKAIKVEGETIKLDTTNEDGAKYLHRVCLHGLQPQTKYFYNVHGESMDTLSDQFSFTMPPVLAGNTHSFMVYGDLGTETHDMQFLLQEALNEKYEAVFHVGDIAYDLNKGQGQIGDKFLQKIEKVAARTPYMTVPGDHERNDEFLHYRYRFSMPNLPWPMPSDNLWYSIDIGPIHFVLYSTEVFFYDEVNIEEMLQWLKTDLDKANTQRSARPWIIAMGHRPMYCSIDKNDEDCKRDNSLVRTSLEDLFYAEGVDLVISGHEHYYERTWPVYNKRAIQYNYREPAAPVHITIGTLGSVYESDKSTNVGGQWSAFVLSETGKESFGRLKVFNATHLHWEVRECANNKLVDQIWIIQPYHRPFNLPRVFIPNPLGEMGDKWLQNENSFGLESFLGLSGSHYGDDYQTKLTVLVCVFVICLLGLMLRKKVLGFIRLCCLKQEPCNKLKAVVHNNVGANV
ncbi:acid phosphatase type 7-like [Mercenaria mercenaria]|uniref:acid phosphatase type 7-like n=1 Tax=Mercenaria mercenaria TaxID=6596 RepID=UPI001E1D5982|nr:acid phosphatase type 7-like [Mercenaria mercenaria]XP_045164942.1 acid phosphatase type 7-like [Mercenaria mercenaria]